MMSQLKKHNFLPSKPGPAKEASSEEEVVIPPVAAAAARITPPPRIPQAVTECKKII